ncbi:hypothetical protein [Haloferula sp.]|uniref:hypothetical protein n=1 Tax=Haloferula sp. TaxID=2497595 RepID=UPI003C726B8A
MRTRNYLSLLAAAAVSLPSLASAQLGVGEPHYGGEVTSTLTFNFTITRIGSIRESNGRVVVRGARERFNQRDLMIYVADRENFKLPLGARLVFIPEGDDIYLPGVYIANNQNIPVYNVSEYLTSEVVSEGVVAGNYSENSTSISENSETDFVTALRVQLPDEDLVVEPIVGPERLVDFIDVAGIAKNRYKYTARESRNSVRVSESSRTSATQLQGSGRIDTRPATVTGRLDISGRENSVVDANR